MSKTTKLRASVSSPTIHTPTVADLPKLSAQKKKRTHLGAAPLKTSTAADRAALDAHTSPAAMLSARSTLLPRARSSLGGPVSKALFQVLDGCAPGDAVEVQAAIERLTEQSNGKQVAVAFMTGRRPVKVKPKDISAFSGPTEDASVVADKLKTFYRKSESHEALAGIRHDVADPLKKAIIASADALEVQAALQGLKAVVGGACSSAALVTVLQLAACLPADASWVGKSEFLAGSNPLAALAAYNAADTESGTVIDEAGVEDAKTKLLAAGLTKTSLWAKNSVSSGHRGQVAEALRKEQIMPAAKKAGNEVIQGLVLIDSPPGLYNAKDSAEAAKYLRDNGIKGGLGRYETDTGAHFGIVRTEVDFVVLKPKGDSFEIVSFDNVKAGCGAAGDARKQNKKALEFLADTNVKLVVQREDGKYDDYSDRLSRKSDDIELRTVGPAGDPTYSDALPLTASDITELATRLAA